MKTLQPIRKSFGEYIKIGYEFAKKKKLNKKQLKLLERISLIDNHVLIFDDIIDTSLLRNGKTCLYRKIGTEKAIITAELYKYESTEGLIELMKISKTNVEKRGEILKTINEFLKNVFLGEKIDLESKGRRKYNSSLIKKYFQMIGLFTGAHIKFGLEIGQLLANKKPNKETIKISILLGDIRQICDDFDDYFSGHHEVFGDFKNEGNRLPEILFKKFKGNRKKVLQYLDKKNYKKARDLVLNPKVRRELHRYCKDRLFKIKKIKTNFNYEMLIEDFEKILPKKLKWQL